MGGIFCSPCSPVGLDQIDRDLIMSGILKLAIPDSEPPLPAGASTAPDSTVHTAPSKSVCDATRPRIDWSLGEDPPTP